MRLLLIAFVLGTLAHPVSTVRAFDRTDCIELLDMTYATWTIAKELRQFAKDAVAVGNETSEYIAKKYLSSYSETLNRASGQANIYQAFCKD